MPLLGEKKSFYFIFVAAVLIEGPAWVWLRAINQEVNFLYSRALSVTFEEVKSNQSSTSRVSSLPGEILPTIDPASSSVNIIEVAKTIQTVVDKNPQIDFGVSFVNLKAGGQLDINGDTSFTAASTSKVLIASMLLKKIEAGEISLSRSLSGQTVGDLLKAMLNQSDNEAWLTIMDLLGYPDQISYAKQLGINSYNYSQNTLSSNDMALLLSKLYTGQILNKQHTDLLLSYMQNTIMETLIPPAVPDKITLFHKHGNFEGNLHDAAIIDDGLNPFVLVIFTNNSGDVGESQRVAVFQEITKNILALMSG